MLVIVGSGYTLVTGCQLRAISRQATAAERHVDNLEKTLIETGKAATAAKASADIAARSDRPILIVENFVPQNVIWRAGTHGVTLVNFQIRNCGKAPALTVQLSGNIKLATVLPYPASFADCKQISLGSSVVEAAKDIGALIQYAPQKPAVLLSEIDSIRVENGQILLFVYGRIAYRDVHGGRYETDFGVKYVPIKIGGGERFHQDPEEYNRHHNRGTD